MKRKLVTSVGNSQKKTTTNRDSTERPPRRTSPDDTVPTTRESLTLASQQRLDEIEKDLQGLYDQWVVWAATLSAEELCVSSTAPEGLRPTVMSFTFYSLCAKYLLFLMYVPCSGGHDYLNNKTCNEMIVPTLESDSLEVQELIPLEFGKNANASYDAMTAVASNPNHQFCVNFRQRCRLLIEYRSLLGLSPNFYVGGPDIQRSIYPLYNGSDALYKRSGNLLFSMSGSGSIGVLSAKHPSLCFFTRDPADFAAIRYTFRILKAVTKIWMSKSDFSEDLLTADLREQDREERQKCLRNEAMLLRIFSQSQVDSIMKEKPSVLHQNLEPLERLLLFLRSFSTSASVEYLARVAGHRIWSSTHVDIATTLLQDLVKAGWDKKVALLVLLGHGGTAESMKMLLTTYATLITAGCDCKEAQNLLCNCSASKMPKITDFVESLKGNALLKELKHIIESLKKANTKDIEKLPSTVDFMQTNGFTPKEVCLLLLSSNMKVDLQVANIENIEMLRAKLFTNPQIAELLTGHQLNTVRYLKEVTKFCIDSAQENSKTISSAKSAVSRMK